MQPNEPSPKKQGTKRPTTMTPYGPQATGSYVPPQVHGYMPPNSGVQMSQQPIPPQVLRGGQGAAVSADKRTAPTGPKSNPNSTQNTLHIAEIRDGLTIMNDGSFRSVVMCRAINFDLMSPQEREGVEYAFQGFLNSLYFPIQVFIRSNKVDLRPYLEKLDKIRQEHDNMLLSFLMEDYLDFMANIAQQTNIMDKRFYVVIPYFNTMDAQQALLVSKNFLTTIFGAKEQKVVISEPVLEAAKTELRNRVQAVLNGLQQCGVQGLPLDTQELIELYYDAYNPDTAPRQQLRNFNDLSAPVITKGIGQAPQPNLDRTLR